MKSLVSLILLAVLATILYSVGADAQLVVVQPARPVVPARPVHPGFGGGHPGFGGGHHGNIDKRGRCPRSLGIGICRNDPNRRNCLLDRNCAGSMKCCSDACGKICKQPKFY